MKRWRMVLFIVCIPGAIGWTEEVVVRNVRPVAAALDVLERRFHVPITYEDPPYLFEGDIEDVTAKVARPEAIAAAKDRGDPPLVIRGMKERELRFDAPSGSSARDVKVAVSNILNANNSSDRPPAIFGVKEIGGRYHVYPVRIKTGAGDYVSHSSVLDVRISLEPKARDCREFWMDFCRALARAANLIIELGGGASGGGDCRTKISGQDVTARQMLLDFLAEREASPAAWGKYSWLLLNDAMTPAAFGLNPVMVPVDSSTEAEPSADSARINRLRETRVVEHNTGQNRWDGGMSEFMAPR
jgi:hypothetical protein